MANGGVMTNDTAGGGAVIGSRLAFSSHRPAPVAVSRCGAGDLVGHRLLIGGRLQEQWQGHGGAVRRHAEVARERDESGVLRPHPITGLGRHPANRKVPSAAVVARKTTRPPDSRVIWTPASGFSRASTTEPWTSHARIASRRLRCGRDCGLIGCCRRPSWGRRSRPRAGAPRAPRAPGPRKEARFDGGDGTSGPPSGEALSQAATERGAR